MKIASMQVWVTDQQHALEFYTQKVGLEVRVDVTVPELGNFRWLTVAPPGQEDVAIVLMLIPSPPIFEAETIEHIKATMERGVSGGVFLTTEDIHADFARMKGAGVEFVEEPEERPYGIDCGFRDPFGNHIRLSQLNDLARPS
ncbi:MAG TPA: VOC family protein [Solirubrobacteraceae bacterium]|nr:VOC family protein [Solirubrobacteraceae bacterium]